jgi:FkbM family methyltransferase
VDTYFKRCRWGDFLLLRGDLLSEFVNLYGEWCEGEVELFRSLLSADSTVIEVGSYIGMHSVPLSKCCSHGRVFCYEPQRVIFQVMCANLALNNCVNVFASQFAVGKENSILEIESSAYDKPWNYGAFSLTTGFSTEGHFGGSVTKEPVTVVRLDDEAILHKIERLDLLKIDTEGFEVNVLDGAATLIQECKPFIFVENNRREHFDTLVANLMDRGYRCYWFCSRRGRENNFNRAFWMVQGHDVNMICVSEDKPQPTNLAPVERFDDVVENRIPLY